MHFLVPKGTSPSETRFRGDPDYVTTIVLFLFFLFAYFYIQWLHSVVPTSFLVINGKKKFKARIFSFVAFAVGKYHTGTHIYTTHTHIPYYQFHQVEYFCFIFFFFYSWDFTLAKLRYRHRRQLTTRLIFSFILSSSRDTPRSSSAECPWPAELYLRPARATAR